MKPIAEEAARAIDRAFCLSAPPVDVISIARRLGVDSIEAAELVEDGRLEKTASGTRILVRKGISPERGRFTIAHELGHLLLHHPESELVARRHRIGEDQEERFCEDFAAALLLPRSWVKVHSARRPQSLHTLRVIAGRSNTSLAAACVRLNEVSGWRQTLLHWRTVNGRWGFRWAAGLPSGSDIRIRSTDETRAVLDHTSQTGGDVVTELPLRVGRQIHQVQVQLSVRRGSALALADLTGIDKALS